MGKQEEIGYEAKSKQVRAYELNNCESVYRGIAANTQEYLVFEGLEEESPLSAKEMLLPVATIALGAYIFFAKVNMRVNPMCTVACFAAFAVLMGGMTLSNYLEKNSAVIFQGTGDLREGSPGKRVFKALQGKRLRVLLEMARYSTEVSLIAQFTEASRPFRSPKIIRSVEKKVQYGRYFGSTGFFYPPALKEDIDSLLERLVKPRK